MPESDLILSPHGVLLVGEGLAAEIQPAPWWIIKISNQNKIYHKCLPNKFKHFYW